MRSQLPHSRARLQDSVHTTAEVRDTTAVVERERREGGKRKERREGGKRKERSGRESEYIVSKFQLCHSDLVLTPAPVKMMAC